MYLFFQNIRSIQRRHIQKFRKTFHDIFLLLFLIGGHALQKVHDAGSVFYIRSCRWVEMIFQRKIVPEVFCCCGLSVEICLRKSKHLLTDIWVYFLLLWLWSLYLHFSSFTQTINCFFRFFHRHAEPVSLIRKRHYAGVFVFRIDRKTQYPDQPVQNRNIFHSLF